LSSAGLTSGPRYRTVPEVDILDQLRLFGWAFEGRRNDNPSLGAEIRYVLDRLIRAGLPHERAGDGGRRFDPVELVNFVKQAGLHHGNRLWEERFVATGRRLAEEFGPPGGGGPPTLESFGDRSFSVALARDFHLPHARAGTQVRLRLPLPLEDRALEGLAIDPVLPAGLDADMTITPGRLDACFIMPSTPMVTLAATVSFRARPTVSGSPAAPLHPAETELYTRPRESLLVVSPRLRALAASLSEGTRDPEAMVRRFWAFMFDRLQYGLVHYDALPAAEPLDGILQGGWYDCQMGAALFAALCRASGVPARLISGYLLYPTAPTYHTWSEVWFDDRGWTPFDFGCWDLSAGGRDAAWRDYFYGRIDYRMKTQVMPRIFTGTPMARFPPAWHRLQRLEPEGASVAYTAMESGVLVFRDRITVS
jgi:transglutaminase-like putative cysteine protease